MDQSLNYNDLVSLAQGETLKRLPKSYQVALEIVPRVTKEPESLSDDDIDRLRECGFEDDEIMELFAQGDLATMFNTITMLYNIPLDEGYKPILDEVRMASVG